MGVLNPILGRDEFLQIVNTEYKKLGITQEFIADYITKMNQTQNYLMNQSQISKILSGRRSFSYEEAAIITQLIVGLSSFLPQDTPINKLGTISKLEDLFHGYEDQTLYDFALEMFNSTYSQAPILERETNRYLGVVTEESILNKLLSSPPIAHNNPLEQLSRLRIENADIIEDIPHFPDDTPIAQIGQALINYYAVMLTKNGDIVGVVTRADFLKLIFQKSFF